MGQRPAAPKKNYIPDDVVFQTKPQIALDLVKRALGNGIRVAAWNFDEFYGRNGPFLDGLEKLDQVFVGEVPTNFHGWLQKPKVRRRGPRGRNGRPKTYPRLTRRPRSCEVQNLLKYSPVFRGQSWQRYHIKNTDRGPEVWEVKRAVFWRKRENGLPGRRHGLIVARNVLTGEVKYFLSNRVPDERGISLRWLLQVAFGRWVVESCFRQAKEEGCNSHSAITQLSHIVLLAHFQCGAS